jgi:hypothetical protein
MRNLSRAFSMTMILLVSFSSQYGCPLSAGAQSAVLIHRVQSLNGTVNVLNVMAPPYNARGDGKTDDLNAIQHAIFDGEGAAPPNFPPTNGRTIYLPRTPTGKCYEISKPLRVAAGPIEIKGDQGSCIQKLYAGPTIINESWNIDHLTYGPALVGKGSSLSTVGCTAANCGHGLVDLAQYLNTSQINLATVFGRGFDIEFWMEPTSAAAGNVLESHPATPGTGNGMFNISFNGKQVSARVNTRMGLVSLGLCPAMKLYRPNDIALDWDGAIYRLFQDGTLCSSTRSANAPILGPFEAMLLPDLGTFDYWMAGGVLSNPFQGYLDQVRFYQGSLHKMNYSPSTTRFPSNDDGHTQLLLNWDTSLDGTQLAYTFGRPVYLPVLGGGAATNTVALHLHDLELCADDGNVSHRGDGYFAQWSVGSEIDHVKCSNAVFAGLNFYNNDYGSYEHDNIVDGGMLGILHGVAWNGSLAQNDDMDLQSVACEETVGDGGGGFHDIHEGCVNRGGLYYCKMYMGEGFASLIDADGCDQEAGDTNYRASILLYGPSAPMVFNAPDLSGVSGKPFIEQDGGGTGPTIVGGQFQQGRGASQIINYRTAPSSPAILINPQLPTGVPLSNNTGDPWVQVISNGTTSHPTLHLGTKAANFSVSWATQDTVTAVLGASRLSVTFMNPTMNSVDYLQLCQDSAGSRTGTRFTIADSAETLKWANDTPPTLTSTANKCDRLKFAFDGAHLVGALDVGNF